MDWGTSPVKQALFPARQQGEVVAQKLVVLDSCAVVGSSRGLLLELEVTCGHLFNGFRLVMASRRVMQIDCAGAFQELTDFWGGFIITTSLCYFK